jgi:hypothetical protein
MTDLNCVTREIHIFNMAAEQGCFDAATLATSTVPLSQDQRGTAWDKMGQAVQKLMGIRHKFSQVKELATRHQKGCPAGRG